jgi:hypothetical protein
MGVVDVVFASAVLGRAQELQLGVVLDRDGAAKT